MRDLEGMAESIPLGEAVENFYTTNPEARSNLTPAQYRNKVITVYLAGMDARYSNFVTALSTQNKSSNLGLETLALALSSGATLAGKSTANALSAGSALALGTNSKVNEKLFFERTLPAVITAMNAARYEAKVPLIEGMSKSAEDYPMEMAFGDLSVYERAASFDLAVGRVTAAIAAAERIEKATLDDAKENASSPN